MKAPLQERTYFCNSRYESLVQDKDHDKLDDFVHYSYASPFQNATIAGPKV